MMSLSTSLWPCAAVALLPRGLAAAAVMPAFWITLLDYVGLASWSPSASCC